MCAHHTLCYRLRFLYMGRYGYNDLESEFFGLSEIVSTEYHLIYVISLHQRPLTSWVFRSCFNSIEYVGETITFVYMPLCVSTRISSGDISIFLSYLGIFTSVTLIISVPSVTRVYDCRY